MPVLDAARRKRGTNEPLLGALSRTALPVPLHLALSLARYPHLNSLERLQVVRAALALQGLNLDGPSLDERTFGDWLRRYGQSPRALESLWDLVGVATLNATADQASLALAAKVFKTALLSEPGAADIGWATVPLGEIHPTAALEALRRERSATFDPATGPARLRLAVPTRIPGLLLAGAWTATGWPATMERRCAAATTRRTRPSPRWHAPGQSGLSLRDIRLAPVRRKARSIVPNDPGRCVAEDSKHGTVREEDLEFPWTVRYGRKGGADVRSAVWSGTIRLRLIEPPAPPCRSHRRRRGHAPR